MKGELATALLSNVMDWSEENLASERLYIEMMAELKYDEYQQYSHGMRFVESLAQWLDKFEKKDRQKLYQFIKENLVYLSATEIRQLIDISFNLYIKPIIVGDAKFICNKENITDLEERKEVFRCCRRQTLFLGLSDGAHIDIFRRDHPFLSNEQIHVHYDFSITKIQDIMQDLCNDTAKIKIDGNIEKKQYRNIVLLDDFSASGISFIRKDGDIWKGKIPKFLNQLESYSFDYSQINFHVLLYVATNEARSYIEEMLKKLFQEKGFTNNFSVITIQSIQKANLTGLDDILKSYYMKYNMSTIENEHYKKGKLDSPYLGFNECSLALVLYHNSPNNSLPILWFNDKPLYKGLFPRVNRHKEEV